MAKKHKHIQPDKDLFGALDQNADKHFFEDAQEGFQGFDSKTLRKDIAFINEQLPHNKNKRRALIFYTVSAAASFLLLLVAAFWLLPTKNEELATHNEQFHNENKHIQQDSPVADELYLEVISADTITMAYQKNDKHITKNQSIKQKEYKEEILNENKPKPKIEHLKNDDTDDIVAVNPPIVANDGVKTDLQFTNADLVNQNSGHLNSYHASSAVSGTSQDKLVVENDFPSGASNSKKDANKKVFATQRAYAEKKSDNYQKANQLFEAGDFTQCIKVLEEQSKKTPLNNEENWLLANAYLLDNKQDKAKKLLQAISQTDSPYSKMAADLLKN